MGAYTQQSIQAAFPVQTRQTNPVQTFLRALAFLVAVGIVFLLFSPLLAISIGMLPVVIILALLISSVVAKMFYVLPEWEKMVLLRLGKFSGIKGPGLFIIPPFIYSVARIVDTRIITHQVEATATLTKDNVPTKITAAIEFQVENPRVAVINVKDYLSTVVWLSTEALKNTIGGLDLKELLSNREKIAKQLRNQIDKAAEDYGINVRAVRITDLDTPPELVEELAVIARARRAAQAKKIQAEAEVQVANKMAEASQVLAKKPGAFKLREIQNLAEISKEESSMIIIYPSESAVGAAVANASVSLNKRK